MSWYEIGIDDETFHVPKDYFLMVHTRLLDTACALLCAHGESGISFPESFYEYVEAIIMRVHGMYFSQGHHLVELSKNWESICIGIVLEREDSSFFDNGEFLAASVSTLKDQNISPDGLISLLKRLSSFELLEIAGMSKFWGHPFISGAEGIEKLHTRTTQDK